MKKGQSAHRAARRRLLRKIQKAPKKTIDELLRIQKEEDDRREEETRGTLEEVLKVRRGHQYPF